MKRVSIIVAILLATCLPAQALPRDDDRWIRVDTDHFTLFSNAGERQTRQLGRYAEKLKQALEVSSEGLSTASPLPTSIYVFRDEHSFHDYKLDREGRSENLAGYFVRAEEGNYVAIDIGSGYRPEELLFHEYVHFWLSNSVPEVPLWIGEGLAEYYSTFRSHANFADIGRFVEEHVAWLRDGGLIPMADLLAAGTSSPDYHEADRVGTFYAQSWAAVHYLMSDSKRRALLGSYFKRINAREDPVEAFRDTWGLTPEQFHERLTAYVARGTFPFYKLTFERQLRQTRATVRDMDRSEVLFRLGELLAHSPPLQFGDAEQHLLAALKLDESLAPAWATLGYLAQLQGRDDQATTYFERALEFDADNARTQRLYGSNLLERFEDTLTTGFETFEETPETLAQARRSFELALELEPGHPSSLAGLARTYVYQPESPEALLALQRGIAAAPGRGDLVLDLIIVSAYRGNLAGARRLLEVSLRPYGDSNMTRSAETIVTQVSIERAFSLADTDRKVEAVALLRETAASIENVTLQRQLLAQAVSIGADAVNGADLDLYRAAMVQANEGDFDAAILKLEELIASSVQEELLAAAHAQRDSLIEVKRETENITLYNRAITLANNHRFEESVAALDELLTRDLDRALRVEAEKVKREVASLASSAP